MNRRGEKFDWDNDDLVDLQAVNEQPKLVHPDIISEIPGVETTNMYNRIIGPTLLDEKEEPLSYAKRAAKACMNTGLDTGDQAREVIRKQYEVIVIDDDNDDIIQGVFVKEDPVDRFSVSGEDNFPGQEMVNPDKINEVFDKGETLGCSKKKIRPRTLFSPKMKGKTSGRKITTGVGFS